MSAPDSPHPDVPGLPDGPGGAGGPSPMDLLASAQEAMAAQVEAAGRTVEGSAGGGVVRVTMTGGGEVTGVTLSPAVVDPSDVEMLQDLILAALRDAGAKVVELQRAALGAFGGIDIGSTLGQLFGGDEDDEDDDGDDDDDAGWYEADGIEAAEVDAETDTDAGGDTDGDRRGGDGTGSRPAAT